MKALSLWQPWASLVSIEAKRIETRDWTTSYRGPIAIHASKVWNRAAAALCAEEPFRSILEPIWAEDSLPLGAIVAVATLDRVMPTEWILGRTADQVGFASDQERAFGNYGPQRFGWYLTGLAPLRHAVPCRGYQKIWTLDPAIAARVQVQACRVGQGDR